LGNIENLDEYQIELNTDIGVDQRYNTPIVFQVAAIWEEGSDSAKQFEMSIMICGNSGEPQYIKAYHGCYDPLSYPLFSLMVRLVGIREYCMQIKAIP
jgi:hypothetical protein